MAVISTSDIKTFKACRLQWKFSSPLQLGLRPRIPKVYFAFGSAIHESLERYYIQNDEAPWEYFTETMQTVVNEFGDTPLAAELEEAQYAGEYVLRAYVRWAKANDRFKVVGAEDRLKLELASGHEFTFQYDGLVEKPDGTTWLLEFKTAASLPKDLGYLHIDDQCIAYQWAAEVVLGIPISGTIYTWIRRKAPTWPTVLKSGAMQKRSNIVTTADAYLDALKVADLNPLDYKEFIQHIAETEQYNFFARAEVVASPKQRKLMAKRINDITWMMTAEHVDIYPAAFPLGSCRGCHFKDPCAALHAGINIRTMLEENYEEGGYY